MLRDILDTRMFELSGTPITLGTLLGALLIFMLTYGISRLIQHTLMRFFRSRGLENSGINAVLPRLLHYVFIAVGFTMALDTIGFSLGALFTAGAVFAVGLGFAMQNIAQNFVSGTILLIERSIKPGDILEVEGKVVRVVQMGIRTTIARTRDEEELIIPNSAMVQNTVKNYTLQDSQYRVRGFVGVVYSSDLEQVQQVLEKSARKFYKDKNLRPPRILLTGFGDSSINYDVSIWIDDPWESPRMLSALNLEIWRDLKANGITIAFPQLDVHFDQPVHDSFARLAAPAA